MRSSLLLSAIALVLLGAASLAAQAPGATPGGTAVQAGGAPPPRGVLRAVVLDAGHGGTDAGARGPGGIVEREVTVQLSRAVRAELERLGIPVLLTREGNENPSFDERALLANTQPGTLFISLHVSSTGRPGTARAFFFTRSGAPQANAGAPGAPAALLRWEEAQTAYAGLSRRFAELLQGEMVAKFPGSLQAPGRGAVRQLRSVAGAAVAVELSSVAAPNLQTLEQMAPGLATAIARAVHLFRPIYEAAGD